MLKEIPAVRDKVYSMISKELVEKYLLKRIDLDRDVEDFEKEFYVLEDVYYYLKERVEREVRNVAEGGDFLDFFYSVLLGVLDVGEELLARLEGVIEELEK
jgi:hypothetical protein